MSPLNINTGTTEMGGWLQALFSLSLGKVLPAATE